ncbi:hypothetical protein IE4803_CH01525 [Rhizobium etli bv. phaseoli str. IE4803]|nr:hypothetical protein IE4803_CH01525 [Rhizobium etli bv. phaseoli str. IE4803]
MGSGLSRHGFTFVGRTFSTRQAAVKTCLHQNGKHFRPMPQRQRRNIGKGIAAQPRKAFKPVSPDARKTAIRRQFS